MPRESASRTRRPRARPPGASGVQLGEAEARARVLAGAARVFSKTGVRDATVQDILEVGGVSRRTFYRLYESKEDVVVALYRMGTDRLIEECRSGMAKETDPIKQIQCCVDAHLGNARDVGRLVFVLGGEAQRQESELHRWRMETHERLVNLLMSTSTARKANIDPLLVRGLVLALEGVTRIVLEEGDEGRNVTEASMKRARRVMVRMSTAAFAGKGRGVEPLPTLD